MEDAQTPTERHAATLLVNIARDRYDLGVDTEDQAFVVPKGERLVSKSLDAEVRGNWAVHKTLGARPGDYSVTLLPDGLLVRTFLTRQGYEAKRRVDILLENHPELEYADSSMARAGRDLIWAALWGNE